MVKPGLEVVEADPRYWRFLPGAATDTRLGRGRNRAGLSCLHPP